MNPSQKGASSVIVILVLLILLVFGLAALTASLSHVNLGRKAIQWSGEFRELEDMAEETLFVIDGILAEAAARSDLPEDYYRTVSHHLSLAGFTVKQDEASDHFLDLSFRDPSGQSPKNLFVRLLIRFPNHQNGTRYLIQEWILQLPE